MATVRLYWTQRAWGDYHMTMTSAFDWTGVAASWDEHRADVEQMKVQVTDELLARLALHPGERVLELGAGTGELAVRLAAAVAPGGHVIASDVAPGMVSLLRTTLEHVDSAEVTQLDASATGLPAGSVEVIVSRMVLMLIARPAAVLSECHRLLAARGRLGIAVWAGPEHNPWMTSVGMAAMMHGLVSGGPPTGPGGLFSLAAAGVLEGLVRDAGFSDVIVAEAPTVSRFATPDQHFDTVMSLAGPLSAALAAAPDDVRGAVRTTAAQLAERHRTADGLVLPGRALVCTARVGA